MHADAVGVIQDKGRMTAHIRNRKWDKYLNYESKHRSTVISYLQRRNRKWDNESKHRSTVQRLYIIIIICY